jgi:hypothetical protein
MKAGFHFGGQRIPEWIQSCAAQYRPYRHIPSQWSKKLTVDPILRSSVLTIPLYTIPVGKEVHSGSNPAQLSTDHTVTYYPSGQRSSQWIQFCAAQYRLYRYMPFQWAKNPTVDPILRSSIQTIPSHTIPVGKEAHSESNPAQLSTDHTVT